MSARKPKPTAAPPESERDAHVEALRGGPLQDLPLPAKIAASASRLWLIEHGHASEWPHVGPVPAVPAATPLDAQGLPRNPYEQRVYTNHQADAAPAVPKHRPKLITELLDDIEEEEESWLWGGRIPFGTPTLIMGRMDSGKSTLLSYLASTVSLGRNWPDCPDDNEAGSVVILQAEESKKRAIKPRMAALGFGQGKVHLIKGVDRRGEGEESWFNLGEDVGTLADRCREIGDVKLVVVDPIGSYIKGINGNNENETRAYLAPLFQLAEDFDCAVVIVAHPNKDEEKDILNRISGSGALPQMCRMAWYLSPDPNDKSRRLLSLLKGNMDGATRSAIALHYDVRKKRMTWFSDPIDLSARDVDHLLQREARESKLNAKRGPDPTESKRAEEFLLEILAKGPILQSSAQDQALNVGIKESSFRKALKRLLHTDGRVHREKGAEDGRWWLTLLIPAEGALPDDQAEGGEAPGERRDEPPGPPPPPGNRAPGA